MIPSLTKNNILHTRMNWHTVTYSRFHLNRQQIIQIYLIFQRHYQQLQQIILRLTGLELTFNQLFYIYLQIINKRYNVRQQLLLSVFNYYKIKRSLYGLFQHIISQRSGFSLAVSQFQRVTYLNEVFSFRFKNNEVAANEMIKVMFSDQQITVGFDMMRQWLMVRLHGQMLTRMLYNYQNQLQTSNTDQKHALMIKYAPWSTLIQFLRSFRKKQLYKHFQLLEASGLIDTKLLLSHFKPLLQQKQTNINLLTTRTNESLENETSLRLKFVQALHQKYTTKDYNHCFKFDIFLLIQSALISSERKFQNYYKIYTQDEIQTAVDVLSQNIIVSAQEFEMKALFSQKIQYAFTQVRFYKEDYFVRFRDNLHNLLLLIDDLILNLRNNSGPQPDSTFTLLNTPDKVLNNIFEALRTKFFRIHSTLNEFIIVRDQNFQIYKYEIKNCIESTVEDVEEFLKQFQDGDVYEVIIQSRKQLKEISQIKLKHLTYVYSGDDKYEKLSLSYPEELDSLSLTGVSLSNLNECTNLRILFSFGNKYNEKNVKTLTKLQRFYTMEDTYTSTNKKSLLNELFDHNKLEYVAIIDGKNIVSNKPLDKNLEKLQIIYHGRSQYQDKKLKINFNSLYTEKFLRLFFFWFTNSVFYDKKDYEQYKQKLTKYESPEEDMKAEKVNVYKSKELYEYFGHVNLSWQNQQVVFVGAYAEKWDPRFYFAEMISQYGFLQQYTERALISYSYNNYYDIYTYAKRFQRYNQSRKQFLQQKRQEYFDIEKITKYIQGIKRYQQMNLRIFTMVKLFKEYNKNSYTKRIKYNIFYLISYLMQISQRQFKKEFGVQKESDVIQFVQSINELQVYTVKQFNFHLSIGKHLKCNDIVLNIQKTFSTNNLGKSITSNMLNNVEDRIQWILSNIHIIIIHRISDHKVFMKVEEKQLWESEDIEKYLQRFQDNEIYDVVITGKIYEGIGKMKIRYLNYNTYDDCLDITLSHPEFLISVALIKCRITNIYQCVNLRNIYSFLSMYYYDDLINLKNLKIVTSIHDEYFGYTRTLLDEIFASSKPEYVCVSFPRRYGRDVFIHKNMENLKFFYSHIKDASKNVFLDVRYLFSEKVQALFKKWSFEIIQNKNATKEKNSKLENRDDLRRLLGDSEYVKLQHLYFLTREFWHGDEARTYFVDRVFAPQFSDQMTKSAKNTFWNQNRMKGIIFLKQFNVLQSKKQALKQEMEIINIETQNYEEEKKQEEDKNQHVFFQQINNLLQTKIRKRGNEKNKKRCLCGY